MPYQCTDDSNEMPFDFVTWISSSDNPWEGTETPEGDFTTEFIADATAPALVSDFNTLYSYLNSQDACQEAHYAAEVVWNSYKEYEDAKLSTRIRGKYQPG